MTGNELYERYQTSCDLLGVAVDDYEDLESYDRAAWDDVASSVVDVADWAAAPPRCVGYGAFGQKCGDTYHAPGCPAYGS